MMGLDWCERSSCATFHPKKKTSKCGRPKQNISLFFYSRTRIVVPCRHLNFRTKKEMMYLIESNDQNFQTVYFYSSEEG